MFSSLDQAVLTLSKGFLELVEVMKVRVADGLLDLLDPLVSLSESIKVIDSSFVGENEHEWIQDSGTILEELLVLRLDENASKRLHVLVLLIVLVLVRVELLAK